MDRHDGSVLDSPHACAATGRTALESGGALMIEGHRVAKFVMDTLTADVGAGGVNTLVGGRIRRDRLGQGMALPGVTVTLVGNGDDLNTIGGVRVAVPALVDVRVVGDGNADYAPLLPIADRIDAVLQHARGLKDGVVVVKLVRRSVVQFTEDDASKPYSHVIQSYATPAYAT
jgi:hypothetical protein